MISATFVDRPRLAVVIAVVISIAGALALLRIPVAQFPDIVPPQVPSTIFGRKRSFSSCEACFSMAIVAPCVRPG